MTNVRESEACDIMTGLYGLSRWHIVHLDDILDGGEAGCGGSPVAPATQTPPAFTLQPDPGPEDEQPGFNRHFWHAGEEEMDMSEVGAFA